MGYKAWTDTEAWLDETLQKYCSNCGTLVRRLSILELDLQESHNTTRMLEEANMTLQAEIDALHVTLSGVNEEIRIAAALRRAA